MNERVKEIEIVFENCEHFVVPASDIYYLRMADFDTIIERCAINSILRQEIVKDVAIVLAKEANADYIPFGNPDFVMKKFDRLLRHNDIAQIQLNYDDGSTDLYYPSWCGFSEYENHYQKITIDEDGRLSIRIIPSKYLFSLENSEEAKTKGSATDETEVSQGREMNPWR